MIPPKKLRENFAKFLLEDIDRITLKELIKENVGEASYIDFKETWPEKEKLAKHILGFANSGGGIIVIGVKQESDGTLNPIGLEGLKDKSQIVKEVEPYIPQDLEYEILDFFYNESEWGSLKGKKFQVLIVIDTPQKIPFLSLKDGKEIKRNIIYYRNGAITEPATYEQVQEIINRRIETGYSTRNELTLRAHLNQLKELYEFIPKYRTKVVQSALIYKHIIKEISGTLSGFLPVTEEVKNPNYPEEDFEAFILRMINLKKEVIKKIILGEWRA